MKTETGPRPVFRSVPGCDGQLRATDQRWPSGHEFGANGVRVRASTGSTRLRARRESSPVMGPSQDPASRRCCRWRPRAADTRKRHVNGIDLASLDSVHRAESASTSIGYVFQDYNRCRPSKTLNMPLQLDGVSPSKVRAYDGRSRQVGVARTRGSLPREALRWPTSTCRHRARGLVGNRSVILADEPTGALDSHTGEQIMLVLRPHKCWCMGILVTHEARMAT